MTEEERKKIEQGLSYYAHRLNVLNESITKFDAPSGIFIALNRETYAQICDLLVSLGARIARYPDGHHKIIFLGIEVERNIE
jgi:hypothetical protein